MKSPSDPTPVGVSLPAQRNRRGTTTQRGYGKAHQRARALVKPLVDAGAATCARCSKPILPGEEWDLDHTDDRTGYNGPAHARCNRARRSPERVTSRNW